MKTYNDIYIGVRRRLRKSGIEAYDLEARLIMAYATGKTQREFLRDSRLYAMDPGFEDAVDSLIKRRISGEPIAYIVSEWEFYGLPMAVTQDVLIPRADTEVLARAAIELVKRRHSPARLLDLCCGSGCVGIAVSANVPSCRVVLADKFPEVVKICRLNIQKNSQTRMAACIEADVFERPPKLLGLFDVIVSNPPYIPSCDIHGLDCAVRDYEPVSALDGGADGLDYFTAISSNWRYLLKPGGYMAFECGIGQAESVKNIMEENGFVHIEVIKDLRGIDRVVIGKIQGG